MQGEEPSPITHFPSPDVIQIRDLTKAFGGSPVLKGVDLDVPEGEVGPGEVRLRVGFNGICGSDLHEYYAGTETNGLTYVGPEDWLAHPGTVGRAIDPISLHRQYVHQPRGQGIFIFYQEYSTAHLRGS